MIRTVVSLFVLVGLIVTGNGDHNENDFCLSGSTQVQVGDEILVDCQKFKCFSTGNMEFVSEECHLGDDCIAVGSSVSQDCITYTCIQSIGPNDTMAVSLSITMDDC
ncbi:hypothetical protein SNE40_019532 [Patella caerulea]|uniref:Uncharacterized protein n=1 Tax=Patella caerulea TaxID=87958 RepID=A0AAN8PIW2_PATCE